MPIKISHGDALNCLFCPINSQKPNDIQFRAASTDYFHKQLISVIYISQFIVWPIQ